MNGTNLFKIALRALANNKLRAFLTMLGIIIGVASVITMLAIGQGSKRSIQQQISEMGSNMIMIHPGADRRGGVRQDPSAMQTLKLTDYEALRDETNFLSAISPNVSSSGQLIAGNNNYPSSVSGVGLEYLEIRQLSVETGDMFTEADIQSSAKVCVIGKTIVDNLFPDGGDPIGKIIRFNKIPFRVVGVLKAKGYNSMGQDQDNIVLAPYTTVMKRLLAVTYLQGVFASALTEDMTEYATDEITEILRRNHKLKASDEDDFTIRTQQELSTMLNSTTDLMTTLLACIAGISLVVGGIGIMNIMYVSVTERTREIGLRMSVGARGVDILSQFLIEAIMISITGGLIGVVIGCGASWIVKSVAHCHRSLLRMVSCKESCRFRPDRGYQIRIKNYLCLYETNPYIRTSSPGSTDTCDRLGDYVRFSVLLRRARKRKHQLDGIRTSFCRTAVLYDRVLRQLFPAGSPVSFPEPEQEVYYLQYSPVVCHRSDAASLAESDIRPFLCSQAPVGSSSGMAVLCQRYAEPRFHHRTECRNTYECPMDASGSSPQGGRTESFGSRAEESAEPTESAFSAQHIEQYLCINCFRYGQSTTGCAGTK